MMNSNTSQLLTFFMAVTLGLTGVSVSRPVAFSQNSIKEPATSIELKWRAPPTDNPLRGLVPYASQMPCSHTQSNSPTCRWLN